MSNPSQPSRRDVLKTGAATMAAIPLTSAAMAAQDEAQDAPKNAGVHQGGNDVLKVGLIGCGGRGTGAAANALRADPETKLVAMADLFSVQIERSHESLLKTDVAARIDVPAERRFLGFDAFEHVVDFCDVVLLTSAPYFRPKHLAHAIEKGKHVFCEKPVATDAFGIRSIIETVEKARQKKLAIVSGLCYRYHKPKIDTMRRIHEGAIGDILALQATYHASGLWHRGDDPSWTPLEKQLRNWTYYTWLAGDIIAEQHIHSLDKIAWAMGNVYPIAATASGGRIQRTDPKYGNVYDHFSTVYEFPGGVKGFSSCRQWDGCTNDVSDFAIGTRGIAALQSHRISGENKWRFEGKGGNMYDDEHVALFESIRKGEPINNGEYMWKSTLMALLGRMSAYTGKRITWDEALASQERLGPKSMEDVDFEPMPVAVPGVRAFV
ncbi:MAG: Gfo/Idh/MocA family oxidoreductase [Planctomycetes bacterium]|nr:Gfo/Idh/MocA family oxidoreductase [Planctomycetota bacterium]MCB9918281.1 Gfo/Idh/MocA family oxidoreductase [Planctomycetota bacterium]